jgi:hypothetical protein
MVELTVTGISLCATLEIDNFADLAVAEFRCPAGCNLHTNSHSQSEPQLRARLLVKAQGKLLAIPLERRRILNRDPPRDFYPAKKRTGAGHRGVGRCDQRHGIGVLGNYVTFTSRTHPDAPRAAGLHVGEDYRGCQGRACELRR